MFFHNDKKFVLFINKKQIFRSLVICPKKNLSSEDPGLVRTVLLLRNFVSYFKMASALEKSSAMEVCALCFWRQKIHFAEVQALKWVKMKLFHINIEKNGVSKYFIEHLRRAELHRPSQSTKSAKNWRIWWIGRACVARPS